MMVKATKSLSAVDAEKQYAAIATRLDSLRTALVTELRSLLHKEGVALAFSIESRVKSWQSIADKLQRTGLALPKLSDMQDLVGIRLILQFRRDIATVCSIIEDSLDVIRRYDTAERLKENQFGYASKHFVVRLKPSWLAVPTMSDLGGLLAEIQVRTTAQHIWAGASQLLQYKQETSVPSELKRSVYRVSALLEMVDLEFERILVERETYRANIADETPAPSTLLNVDLLAEVLDGLLPAANKSVNESYEELLGQLREGGIETKQHLVDFHNELKEYIAEAEAERVVENNKRLAAGKTVTGTSQERASKGVFFTHVGLIRIALRKAGKVK